MYMSGIPILSQVPKNITAGDTVKWSKSFADYLASDGWVVTYYFANAAESFDVVGAAYQTSDFLFTLLSATTESLAAAQFNYEAYAVKGSERARVECGTIQLAPNFATGDPVDNRSNVKITLDALEAMLANKATSDQLKVEVLGKKLEKYSPEDLLKWRSVYKSEYQSELAACNLAKGLGTGRRVTTRFTDS